MNGERRRDADSPSSSTHLAPCGPFRHRLRARPEVAGERQREASFPSRSAPLRHTPGQAQFWWQEAQRSKLLVQQRAPAPRAAPSLATARATPPPRLLARGGLRPADVGAARQGGHAAGHLVGLVTRFPLCPFCFCCHPLQSAWPGPSTPGPQASRLSVVGGSSQLLCLGRYD